MKDEEISICDNHDEFLEIHLLYKNSSRKFILKINVIKYNT